MMIRTLTEDGLWDGLDTADVPFHGLRTALAIIHHSIRSYLVRRDLDFQERYTDAEIYQPLERVALRYAVDSLPDGAVVPWYHSVVDRNSRAILRDSPIIVLDEAIPNIDFETGTVIEKTTEFNHR